MEKNSEIIRRDGHTPGTLRVRETADGGGRTIEGYAILFDVPSEVLWADGRSEAREVIAPEAITREVLDANDIKFTMFHDRQLLLARSRNGSGTLKYEVDGKGVRFEFEAPRTQDGDKALEMVRRGDVSGCSFAFCTAYRDKKCVERTEETADGKTLVTYRVKRVSAVLDFTLAADPAYPQTSVSARDLESASDAREDAEIGAAASAQVAEMRAEAKREI